MARPFESELLLEHAAHVRALARRIVFDAELADEVEQETWLAALMHAPRRLRDPRAWLARVVRHAAGRLRARHARRNEHDLRAGIERAADLEARSDDPSGLLERELALRALLAAVRRLPEPVRRAVVLHHLDGLTLAEVARRTEAPLETVRSRVKRGLELLRADFAQRRDRAGWSVFLVRAFEIAPPACGGSGRGLVLLLRELAVSMMLMSSPLKLGAGIAVLLVVAGFLLLEPGARRGPDAPGAARRQDGVEALVAGSDADVEKPPEERRAVMEPSLLVVSTEAQSVTPRTGAVLLHVIWADDHSPAIDVPVRVVALNAGTVDSPWENTSSDGSLERRELEPGTVLARSLFGGLALVEVAPGETREGVLEIPIGISVHGRVETRDGDAIPGAELFLSPGGGDPQYDGRTVARADARGVFTVRTAPAGVGACLSARATGYAPSEQVILTGPAQSKLELAIVLAEPGRVLSGLVLSPTDEPVEDAEVLVGSEGEWIPRRRADGMATWAAIGELVRTDQAGRFTIAAVPLSAVPIQVRARRHPVWRCEVAPDAPQPIVIHLENGAAVSGVVHASGGAPLAGVRVRVEPALGFSGASTTSAADGSYRLAELASGNVSLVAERLSSGFQLGGAARSTTTLAIVAGAEHRWDPELPTAHEVRGRLEAPGSALDGWTVRGWRAAREAGEESYVEEARTDDSGIFVLGQPPQGEIDLALFSRGGSLFPLARPVHVATDGPEVVLRPDPALAPTCRIAGTLVDSHGDPVRSADVLALHATLGSTLVHPDSRDGTFEIGPLPPGEWTLQVDPLVADWAVTRVAHVLAPAESWDAGKVLLGLGGTLVVRMRSPGAAGPPGTPSGATAELRDFEDRPVAWLTFAEDVAHTRPVAPGSYRLVLTGSVADFAPARPIVIAAGQETTLVIELDAPVR
jgi:RNA polymerase sigma factor (sigma-70 family)